MNTDNYKISFSLYIYFLAAILFYSKTIDKESPIPFTFTFKETSYIKQPQIQSAMLATGTGTAYAVTSPMVIVSANTNQDTPLVRRQVLEVEQQAVNNATFQDECSDKLLINNRLGVEGAVPTNLESELETSANNLSLQGYLPIFTLLQVDVKPVDRILSGTPEMEKAAIQYSLTAVDRGRKSTYEIFKVDMPDDAMKHTETTTEKNLFMLVTPINQVDDTP